MTPIKQGATDRTPFKRCEVADCGRRIESDKLMCPTHWFMVPRPLRNLVWAAWRNYEKSLSSTADRQVEMFNKLEVAQEAAVAAVTKMLNDAAETLAASESKRAHDQED